MVYSSTGSFDIQVEYEKSLMPVVMFSVAFHVFVFLIVPLATKMLWRPKQFVRPHTFQLVSMPAPRHIVRPVVTEQAKPEKSTPVPAVKPASPNETAVKKTVPKPRPETEEDVGDLEDLLGGLQKPVSSIDFSNAFPYHWYTRNIAMKVEQNWRPSIRDEEMYVLVSFTIFTSGSISDIVVKKSSGNAALDRQAVRAIELAAPFGKLPPNFSGNLEVDYTLRPTQRK